MNITDLKNAVNGIDFDREKQEQMILKIQAKKRRSSITRQPPWPVSWLQVS